MVPQNKANPSSAPLAWGLLQGKDPVMVQTPTGLGIPGCARALLEKKESVLCSKCRETAISLEGYLAQQLVKHADSKEESPSPTSAMQEDGKTFKHLNFMYDSTGGLHPEHPVSHTLSAHGSPEPPTGRGSQRPACNTHRRVRGAMRFLPLPQVCHFIL